MGRWISRGQETIVVIRPIEDGLALHQLHLEAEVLPVKELGIESTAVSDGRLKLADRLIDHLAAKGGDPN